MTAHSLRLTHFSPHLVLALALLGFPFAASANGEQEEARAMLDKAQALSEIRKEGGETSEGTYE